MTILIMVGRPPDKSVYLKLFFLFLNQTICCEYSKEEYESKKVITILNWKKFPFR